MSPIRPENRGRYPADWPAISRRIREREHQRCFWCRAPNRQTIVRLRKSGVYALTIVASDALDADAHAMLADWYGLWRDPRGMPLRVGDLPDAGRYRRCSLVRVVLTVAHLDDTPENCADDNLRALCQRCHLLIDQAQHVRNARETRLRRTAERPLPLFEATA